MIQDNAPVSVVVPMANAKQTIGGSGSTAYARRRRLFGLSVPENRFLWQEVAGYVLGLLFYLRSRRG